jgi:hypothetical protein
MWPLNSAYHLDVEVIDEAAQAGEAALKIIVIGSLASPPERFQAASDLDEGRAYRFIEALPGGWAEVGCRRARFLLMLSFHAWRTCW